MRTERSREVTGPNKPLKPKLFLARLGLSFDEHPVGYFASVRINETLTLDFHDDVDSVEIHHYAFKVSEVEFDAIFGRFKAGGLPYGSAPNALQNMDIYHRNGGRGVYFCDPDGHILELLTAD